MRAVKSIVDDSEAPEGEGWDFEGLSQEEQRATQLAEPLWPSRRDGGEGGSAAL